MDGKTLDILSERLALLTEIPDPSKEFISVFNEITEVGTALLDARPELADKLVGVQLGAVYLERVVAKLRKTIFALQEENQFIKDELSKPYKADAPINQHIEPLVFPSKEELFELGERGKLHSACTFGDESSVHRTGNVFWVSHYLHRKRFDNLETQYDDMRRWFTLARLKKLRGIEYVEEVMWCLNEE